MEESKMKKTLKRTLAIVMAVAMLFALSATAFAYDNQGYVTVTINYNETILYNTVLSASDIEEYLAPNADHLYTLPGAGNTVYFSDTLTPADALIAAAMEYFDEDYDPTSIDYTWYDIVDPNNDYEPILINGNHLQGLYFTKFWGYASNNGNYYLVDYNSNTGIYTYVWRGSSWSFSINGTGYAPLYASDYALDGTSPVISSIELTFMEIESEPILRDEPIPGAQPYPGN